MIKYFQENLKTITCLLSIFGVLFGVNTYYHATFAKAEEFKQFVMDFKQGRATEQIIDINREIWQIEREFKNRQMDPVTEDRYKTLKELRDLKKEELDELRGNKKK